MLDLLFEEVEREGRQAAFGHVMGLGFGAWICGGVSRCTSESRKIRMSGSGSYPESPACLISGISAGHAEVFFL